jgi:hypothetical protein
VRNSGTNPGTDCLLLAKDLAKPRNRKLATEQHTASLCDEWGIDYGEWFTERSCVCEGKWRVILLYQTRAFEFSKSM